MRREGSLADSAGTDKPSLMSPPVRVWGMRDSLEDREHGAGERIRTADLRITNALLYQLSYTGDGNLFGAEPKLAEHDMQIPFGQQARKSAASPEA